MDGHYLFNKRFNLTYDIFCCILYYSNNTWFYYFIHGYVGLFDIYSKEHRRLFMPKQTIKQMLEMIDAKIEHIEDITADNRAIIVKLVKQSNKIVEFLRNLELQIDEEYDITAAPSFDKSSSLDEEKLEKVKEMLQEFNSRSKELKEFEKELEKHKDKLTPGQVGES
tara:strand:+ start:11 stop:511 length:501 start_codon:yes stop_codon:yes gene_type:complete